MLVIGLTGGVGTGKSTAAQFFSQWGAKIIDADVIAREVVSQQGFVASRIIEHFGDDVVDDQGELDRRQLRNRIFNSAKEREWLEQLLHPLIREEIQRRIERITSPYCIVVIPLLQGVIDNPLLNRILVVDAPVPLQISRTQERDEVNASDVMAIIEAQYSRRDYLEVADDVINNDGSLEALKEQVRALHHYYLSL